jgi:hypothetical protein
MQNIVKINLEPDTDVQPSVESMELAKAESKDICYLFMKITLTATSS